VAEQGIYREQAIERLSTPDRLDQGLSIVGRATWVVLLALGALVIGGLAWSMLLAVPIVVSGQGMLLLPGGVLDVASDWPGRLASFTINTGDRVTAGSVVARLDQPDLRQELATAESERHDSQEEYNSIIEFQKRKGPVLAASVAQRRRAFEDDVVALTRRIGWLEEKAQADQELNEKKLITRQKILETRIEIVKAQEEKAQAENGVRILDVEVSKAEIDDQRERLTSELKVAAAERKIRALTERLERQSVVISPYDGVVVELKVNPGEIVERSGALFSLAPNETGDQPPATGSAQTGPLYAALFVPPGDGKKVRPGMPVRVSPSSARREEYGFIEGRVRSVAHVPSTVEGMNRTLKNKQLVQTLAKEGAPFEIIIDLLSDPATVSGYRWSSSLGPPLSINSGTLATADVEVRSLPILSLLVPPLRQVLASQ